MTADRGKPICGLCGATNDTGQDLSPYLSADLGLMSVLLSDAMKRQGDSCEECRAAGHDIPAEYTCTEDACSLKALCDAHAASHKRWGHLVAVHTPECGTAGPASAPDCHLLLTHCPKPEHAGADGLLTHRCGQCQRLLCRLCVDSHLDQGHDVQTVVKAGNAAAAEIVAALPKLKAGLGRYTKLPDAIAASRAELDANRASVIESLATAAAQLHAAVDAQHAEMMARAQACYDAKVIALDQVRLSCPGAAGHLATAVAAAESALAAGDDGAVQRIHLVRTLTMAARVADAAPAFKPVAEEAGGVGPAGAGSSGVGVAAGGVVDAGVDVTLHMIDGGSLASNSLGCLVSEKWGSEAIGGPPLGVDRLRREITVPPAAMFAEALRALESWARTHIEAVRYGFAELGLGGAVDWTLFVLNMGVEDATVCRLGMRLLVHMTRARRVLLHAVPTVLAVMRAHPTSDKIVYYCLAFLHNESRHPTSAAAMRAQGLALVVSAACARFPEDSYVVEPGKDFIKKNLEESSA